MLVLLKIESIRTDGGTQTRVGTDRDWVADLAESFRMQAERNRLGNADALLASTIPAIVVFRDTRGVNWLADGFHRLAAWQIAFPSMRQIEADVRQGELRDALFFALGCNKRHGLHRSNDDKHHAVRLMLRDPEWSKWNDSRIADVCGVSRTIVANERIMLQTHDSERLAERGGTTYTMKKKGPRTKPTPELQASRDVARDDMEKAREALCAHPENEFAERLLRAAHEATLPDYSPPTKCPLCNQRMPRDGAA